MIDLGEALARQADWLRAARAGGREAEAAADEACLRCRDAAERMTRNLAEPGYPCEETVIPCADGLDARIRAVEARIGAPLPPVLRTLWSRVGGIALVDVADYEHVAFWDGLGITGPQGFCDGVLVYPCDDEWADSVAGDHEMWMEEDAEYRADTPFVVALSPDGFHKDDISGGEPYGVRPGAGWAPAWENFAWSGAARPRTAGPGAPDLLGYLRTALLECAGFPGLLGVPGFEPVRERILRGVAAF